MTGECRVTGIKGKDPHADVSGRPAVEDLFQNEKGTKAYGIGLGQWHLKGSRQKSKVP